MIDSAIQLERDKDFVGAADAYELALQSEGPSPELIVRAATLYWQCADLPFYAAHHLSDAFVQRSAARLEQLLALGHTLYPDSVEIAFWDRYIAWALTGEEFTLDEARDLRARDPSLLITALRVFAASEGVEAAAEADELLRVARREGTAAMLDIASYIESMKDRLARPQGRPQAGS